VFFTRLRERRTLYGLSMYVCLSVSVASLLRNNRNLFSLLILLFFILLFYGIAFAVLDTPGPLPSQVRSSRPQEDLDCPRRARPLSGTKPPSGHPQVIPSTPTSNQDYITLGALPPIPSPGYLLRWGLAQAIVAPGALPHGPALPCLGHQSWTPLCFHHPGCNI
jgi:hypothetical protein